MKNKHFYYLVVSVLIFATSCSKTDKKPPVLPVDCALVVKADVLEMAKKGALYELYNTPIYKEIINGLKKTKRESLIPYIENPQIGRAHV